jgi:hypothetical protein
MNTVRRSAAVASILVCFLSLLTPIVFADNSQPEPVAGMARF